MPVPFSGISQHKLVNRGHEAVFGHPSSAKVPRDAHQQRSVRRLWSHGLVWIGRDFRAHQFHHPPWAEHLPVSQVAPAQPWTPPGMRGQPQLLWAKVG